MFHVSHATLVAKMGAVAVAHHELRRHIHHVAAVEPPSAPAVHLPTAGGPFKVGSEDGKPKL